LTRVVTLLRIPAQILKWTLFAQQFICKSAVVGGEIQFGFANPYYWVSIVASG